MTLSVSWLVQKNKTKNPPENQCKRSALYGSQERPCLDFFFYGNIARSQVNYFDHLEILKKKKIITALIKIIASTAVIGFRRIKTVWSIDIYSICFLKTQYMITL